MSTGAGAPGRALAAAAGDIAVRIQRLLEPPRRNERIRNRLALLAVIGLLALASGQLTRSTDPLVVRAIAALA
jgi:hypothetical protein